MTDTIRTLLAAGAFAVLYGVAYRLYMVLRARRSLLRWQTGPLVAASLVGATGFYVAQQIRDPYVPRLLDVPAFLIMALGSSGVFVVIELALAWGGRDLRKATAVQSPPPQPPAAPVAGSSAAPRS